MGERAQCREPVEVGTDIWYCTRNADHDGAHSLQLTWETGEYPPNWIASGSVVVRCAAGGALENEGQP